MATDVVVYGVVESGENQEEKDSIGDYLQLWETVDPMVEEGWRGT